MKTNKNSWLILFSIIMIPLMASTCDSKNDLHNCITFVNKSDIDIHVLERFKLISNPSDTFYICGGAGKILKSGEKFCFDYGIVDGWDDYLSAKPYIQYIVLSKPFMENECTEDKVKNFTKKHQLKRYQLTREDLDRMNWTVVYLPEE